MDNEIKQKKEQKMLCLASIEKHNPNLAISHFPLKSQIAKFDPEMQMSRNLENCNKPTT